MSQIVFVSDIPAEGLNDHKGVWITPLVKGVKLRYKINGAYTHHTGAEGYAIVKPTAITVFDGLVIEASANGGPFSPVYPVK